MLIIKKVSINGFWGQYTIETEFHKDVNIFIGKNGTGKTTFINLLQAVISVDLVLLCSLQFSDITIFLTSNKKSRKIVVSKVSSDFEYKAIKYQIGTQVFQIPYLPAGEFKYINKRSGRLHPRFYRDIQEIKEVLKSLINVSYLSVNRDSLFNSQEDILETRREEINNAIDGRMNELMAALTSYQLQLETETSKLSKGFQENVLRSMLFNEEFDHVNVDEPIKLDLKKIQVGLKQAYRVLGILDSKTAEVIEKHVVAISKASEAINTYVAGKNKVIYVNDVAPLTLLRRTKKIIELSIELEENKRKIFKPIHNYIKLLNEFHDKKEFDLQDSKQGGIKILSNDREIDSSHLSSGEKQLIILLTQSLLQKNEQTVFIADEPELSLHIEWQRKVVPSIINLNPNAQVIIATHSPEIVGRFKENTINMEKILHG